MVLGCLGVRDLDLQILAFGACLLAVVDRCLVQGSEMLEPPHPHVVVVAMACGYDVHLHQEQQPRHAS